MLHEKTVEMLSNRRIVRRLLNVGETASYLGVKVDTVYKWSRMGVLSKVKLIAEPWDASPDGYQLGRFPPGWSEWNGPYRDGIRTLENKLNVVATPLSQLARCWTRFPQQVTNVKVREKRPVEQLAGLPGLLAEAEKELTAQDGRLLLRYSGTEPKVRLLVEGRDPAALASWSKKICGAIQKEIGI